MDPEDLLDQFVIEFKRKLRDPDPAQEENFIDYCWKWFNIFKSCKEYNTRCMYENVIRKHFTDNLSGLSVNRIDLSCCQRVINANIDHPRSCRVIALTLKQVLKSAVRDGLYSQVAYESLFSGLSLPKVIKPKKRPLTDLERKAVFAADLSPMKAVFLYVLYYTGIRKGEALALTPDDFDFEKGSVSISKTLIFTGFSDSEIKNSPKSNNGFRSIPLPAECISLIQPYISSCSGYLFKGQGAVLANRSFYRRFWESIVLGLNMAVGFNPWKQPKDERPIKGLTAHIFRHDFCTQLCYQVPEISTKMIAYLLGDSEKMVLEVYSHLMLEKEKVLSSIEKARKKTT